MAELLVWPALVAYGEAALAYAGGLAAPAIGGRLAIWGARLGWLAQLVDGFVFGLVVGQGAAPQQQPAHPAADEGGEDRGPGVHEDDVDVDDEEDHRDDVEADIEPPVGVADGDHAALVGRLLAGPGAARADQQRDRDVSDGEPDPDDQQQHDRRPGGAGGVGLGQEG